MEWSDRRTIAFIPEPTAVAFSSTSTIDVAGMRNQQQAPAQLRHRQQQLLLLLLQRRWLVVWMSIVCAPLLYLSLSYARTTTRPQDGTWTSASIGSIESTNGTYFSEQRLAGRHASHRVDNARAATAETRPIVMCQIIQESTWHPTTLGGQWGDSRPMCAPIIDGVISDQLYRIELPDHLWNEQSGRFTAVVVGGVIQDDSIIISHGGSIHKAAASAGTLGRPSGNSPNKEPIKHHDSDWKSRVGTRSVLVLRVSVSDSEPSLQTDEMRNAIFGFGDMITTQSQYHACSSGKLNLTAARYGDGGILDVVVNGSIDAFVSNSDLSNRAQREAVTMLGLSTSQHISSLVDHVMVCLPPGTGTWIASAAFDHWRSLYNDEYCGVISTTMHEIGHNLGLLHANEKGKYRDFTGYMGAGYNHVGYPRKCFNAQNHWMLGWYDDRLVTVQDRSYPIAIRLYSFVDYNKLDADDDKGTVLVSINDRYFLQYNRAADFNIETGEKWDQVAIVEHDNTGTEMLVGLDEESKEYALQLKSDDGAAPKRMNIVVCRKETMDQYDGAWSVILSISDREDGCNLEVEAVDKPETLPPTRIIPFPSNAPSSAPSETSSAQPSTRMPSNIPTQAHSHDPSEWPTYQPSYRPSPNPSYRPSESPSTSPSVQPSLDPTATPSVHASATPSSPPTIIPTSASTAEPTPSVSHSPSTVPTIDTKMPSQSPTSVPSNVVSSYPSHNPSHGPSHNPTHSPTAERSSRMPSRKTSASPSMYPSMQPTIMKSHEPSFEPSSTPSFVPSFRPSSKPSVGLSQIPSRTTLSPTGEPTSLSSEDPTSTPSAIPTESMSGQPSNHPTRSPSNPPSRSPTNRPSLSPTPTPTAQTESPSLDPTAAQSGRPASPFPTVIPSPVPSELPTPLPSTAPSLVISTGPTIAPTDVPTLDPEINPSSKPTVAPSTRPSGNPTRAVTAGSTVEPTPLPSEKPSEPQSELPSIHPTLIMSEAPSSTPTQSQSQHRTDKPSQDPSMRLSDAPTTSPSTRPTPAPAADPTQNPTVKLSLAPTQLKSAEPSAPPTAKPSEATSSPPSTPPTVPPSHSPSMQPSAMPTSGPTAGPTAEPTPILKQPPKTSEPTQGPTVYRDVGTIQGPLKRPNEVTSTSSGEEDYVPMNGRPSRRHPNTFPETDITTRATGTTTTTATTTTTTATTTSTSQSTAATQQVLWNRGKSLVFNQKEDGNRDDASSSASSEEEPRQDPPTFIKRGYSHTVFGS